MPLVDYSPALHGWYDDSRLGWHVQLGDNPEHSRFFEDVLLNENENALASWLQEVREYEGRGIVEEVCNATF